MIDPLHATHHRLARARREPYLQDKAEIIFAPYVDLSCVRARGAYYVSAVVLDIA